MSEYPTFWSKTLPPSEGDELEETQYQGVHFTVTANFERIMETIKRWFEDADEVIFIDTGTTARGDLHFIILEWEACEIPPSFLEVLEHDDDVDDYTIYLRDETYEEI
jgi:hypothetical protein